MEPWINFNPVACTGPCGKSFLVAFDTWPTDEGFRWFCERCRSGDGGGKKRKLAGPAMEADWPQLPAEIWIVIFEYMSTWQLLRVRVVCRRWRDIVDGNSSLKAKFTISIKHQFIDREYAPVHLYPAPKASLEWLKIAAVGSWWMPLGPSLTELSLEACKIMLGNLLAMLKHTPNLELLELHDTTVECFGTNPVPDFRLNKLDKLGIDGINRVENLEVYRKISSILKSLKIATNCSFHDHLTLLGHVVEFVSVWHRNLEELVVDGDDRLLIELTKLHPWNLKELILQGNEQGLENVNSLFGFCRLNLSLEALHVEPPKIYTFSNHSQELNDICQSLQRLKRLELSPVVGSTQIRPSFLNHIGTTLQDLRLSGLHNQHLTVDFTGIVCPALRSLELTWIQFEGSTLQKFLSHAPNFRTFSLTNCTFSCWTNIFQTIGTCSAGLQKLSLVSTTAPSTSERTFLDYLDQMRVLELADCSNLPPGMLSTLLRLCPRLEVLRLEEMKHVFTPEMVNVLCEKLPCLVRVDIDRCELPEKIARQIRQKCRVQQKLTIG